MPRSRSLLALALVAFGFVFAAQTASAATSRAASPEPKTTYDEMVEQFRSVTCPDETLEQCTSTESEFLKSEIRRMVSEGWTKQQITDAIVADFGDRILSVSARKGITWWLWIMPAVALALGAGGVALLLKRKPRAAVPAAGGPAPAELDPYLDTVEREVREDF